MGLNWRSLLLPLWLCTLVSLPSSLRAECPVTATGVCTPGVEETIVITETESIEYEADGHTVTTETTTTTTTVTTTNEDSGNILDGNKDPWPFHQACRQLVAICTLRRGDRIQQ